MYKIFNLCLASNISLPELPTCTGNADIRFSLVSEQHQCDVDEVRWLHHWHTPDGEPFSSCGIIDEGFILRFPGMADFQISADQRTVCCTAEPEIPTYTIRHLLIDQVIPRILGQRGSLVVHGSAVAVEGKAVVFVGESGLGKSTLAAYLHLQGHPLLTDDCLEVTGIGTPDITITPNYAGARLFDDSTAQLAAKLPKQQVAHYSSKKRVALGSDDVSRGWPLAALFFLAARTDDPAPTIEATEILGMQRIMKLVQCSFGLYAGSDNELHSHFLKQGELANSPVPFLELQYPRHYDQLSRVSQHILSTLLEAH